MSKQNVEPVVPQLPPKALNSTSLESNQEIHKAIQHYNIGEYKTAINSLENLQSDKEDEAELIKLYTANAYLAMNDHEKSEALYKELIDQGKHFTSESKLNLAANFLKAGKTDEAKECLHQLKGTHCERQADELIKSINT